MDYSFSSFTLDIWLILHIIIILFCKPPSKRFPVSKLHSAVTNLSFKKARKARCLFQSSANIVKKEMGKTILQVSLGSEIIMTYQSFLEPANWCLLSMCNPSVRPSRRLVSLLCQAKLWVAGRMVNKLYCTLEVTSEAWDETASHCAHRNPRVPGGAGRWGCWLFPRSWHSPVSSPDGYSKCRLGAGPCHQIWIL